MKIMRLKIINSELRPILNGLEIFFEPSIEGNQELHFNCLIGVNGSGKSQVLESLAEIFYYLDLVFVRNPTKKVKAPMMFELDYLWEEEGKEFLITVQQLTSSKRPTAQISESHNRQSSKVENIGDYLPPKVIGYTSGENETLSIPFLDYYDDYARYTANRANKKSNQDLDYEPRFFLMNYATSITTTITNLLFDHSDKFNDVLNRIGVKGIHSFQLVIQTNHAAAPSRGGVKLTKEHDEWIESLKLIATCWRFEANTNRYVLDYLCTEQTKAAFRSKFVSAITLYGALYRLEVLNNLMIDDTYLREIRKKRKSKKLLTKYPTVPEKDQVFTVSEVRLSLDSKEIVDYLKLSDGEHQILNVFGSILMADARNTLFLLDEPETHFNPKWRREFVRLVSGIASKRNQDFFATTHSPFIVADCRRDNVYVFHKEEGQVKVEKPKKETYGSGFDHILKMAFQMPSTMSSLSLEELEELLGHGSQEEIESKLHKFGDSPKKLQLYAKIEELNSGRDVV